MTNRFTFEYGLIMNMHEIHKLFITWIICHMKCMSYKLATVGYFGWMMRSVRQCFPITLEAAFQ